MVHQAVISATLLQQKVGKEMEVIIDQVDGSQAIARSQGDAPEVDGIVEVSQVPEEVVPGDILRVEITGATDYDLMARPAGSRSGA